jgi:hypothetical protein
MPPRSFDESLSVGGVAVIPVYTDEHDSRQDIPKASEYLRQQLAAGAPWHRTLLEAMGMWTLPEEIWMGRRYKYIVGREAFDWLLLAERLCAEVEDAIPTEELEMLLFHGVLPEPIESDELRSLLGASKHQGYLNYHYGIVLEEALQLAAEESIRKRHIARGYVETGTGSEELVEDAFRHLYNDSRSNLLDEFRRSAGLAQRRSFSLTDLKEFTYWLHKRRVNYWDPARVASDTRLAIRRLASLRECFTNSISS